MNERTPIGTLFRLVSCAFSISVLAAQSSSSTIQGTVRDPAGLPVVAAKVILQSERNGSTQSVATDSSGAYQILTIAVGEYRLTAQAQGLRSATREGIRVGVAERVAVDFTLPLAERNEQVSVTADPVSVASLATSRSITVADSDLNRLPVNGRDYARFSLLAPGAVLRTNNIADLSFNGLPTVSNQFSIDGVDASRIDQPYMANGYERGARLLTGSLDSIAEFKVETSNYRAEFGRASGAWINIATRSGTKDLHGSLFEYFRNSAMDARDFFNRKPATQAPFRFNNFGASLGGPIRKDRLFFFSNYEGSRQRVGATANGTVPSAALRSEVLNTSPSLRPVVNLIPLGTSPTANPRVDNFTTVGVTGVREDTASIRLDFHASDRHRAYARTNWNDSRVRGPLFALIPTLLGLEDRQDVPVRTINTVLHDQYTFSPRWINEFQLGMQRWASTQIQNYPLPRVNITGLTLGVAGGTRTLANQTSYQISNSVSHQRGAHSIRFGGTAWNIRLVRRSTDNVTITYPSIDDFILNRVSQATVVAGNPGSAVWAWQAAGFLQDTWRISSRLSLDIGIRYDGATPPFDPQNRARVFNPQLAALAPAGASYFQANNRNVAPRFGIAWQALPRLTLRAGYGIFFQAYPVGYGIYSVPQNTLPGTTTLRRLQIPDLQFPLDPFLTQGTQALPTVQGFTPEKPDSYAQHWNTTASFALSADAAFDLAWVGNRALNLRRALNLNLRNPVTQQVPYPAFADVNIEAASGQSTYHSLQAVLRKRYRAGLSGQWSYAWAHAIDDVSDPGLFNNQPQDMNNWRPERGNGSGDIRHSFSFQSSYDLPFGRGRRWWSRGGAWVDGWQLAGVGFLRTGVAANITLNRNTSGNGNLANQRPDAVVGVDPLLPDHGPDGWFNPAAFQVPAQGSFGNLGRNTVFGPGFAQFDAALLKETRLGERLRLFFRGEAFNLLNRPNFAQPNTTFGSAAFGRIQSTLGRTLGFGAARQIQLSLRLSF